MNSDTNRNELYRRLYSLRDAGHDRGNSALRKGMGSADERRATHDIVASSNRGLRKTVGDAWKPAGARTSFAHEPSRLLQGIELKKKPGSADKRRPPRCGRL